MSRRKRCLTLAAVLLAFCLAGCASGAGKTKPAEEAERPVDVQMEPEKSEEEETQMLQMKIGETPVAVTWEENESVEALKELCREQPLTISMSMYGGFEQVGSIGTNLPRHDVQTTTEAGDIVLYAGNQLVVFYGSNAWAYTRLGHVSNRSAEEMEDLLGRGDVTITLWLEGNR